jgi:IS5 family transposase
MRFLDLELEDPVPDGTTIWLFREALAEAGLIDKLFERFGQHLEAAGYIARGEQIIHATIVSAPKQRNTKEENEVSAALCSFHQQLSCPLPGIAILIVIRQSQDEAGRHLKGCEIGCRPSG